MNLYGLVVFHHVAEEGSVTRAAEKLRISQPAVTAHVRNLGRELGLSLLAPKGRGVLLTEAGRRVAEHAARVQALERHIVRDLADYAAGLAGTLRIAATSLPACHLLPDMIARFRAESPDVAVSVATLNASEAQQALLRYEADLALIGGGGSCHPELSGTLLMKDEQWFVVAAGHPLAGRKTTLRELTGERFVMREPGSASREALLSLCRACDAAEPEPGLTVSGQQEMLIAVASGFGAAMVSALEARQAVSRGEIARVEAADAPPLRNPIMLVARTDETLPPAAKRFGEIAAEFGDR